MGTALTRGNKKMPQKPIKEAKNRAYKLLEDHNAALERGEIDEAEWYRKGAGDNPRAQSGHGGDDVHWTHARSLIRDAVDGNGTFLDVGCASGYLMESIQRWAWEAGMEIEPYGLDIAPELADLARRRLPKWMDRIYVGNVLYWNPPKRFDFVRTGLEYVPALRGRDLLERLLCDVVTLEGRLIIGTYNEETTEHSVEEMVEAWGFSIAGRSERPHYNDNRLVIRVLWVDANGR